MAFKVFWLVLIAAMIVGSVIAALVRRAHPEIPPSPEVLANVERLAREGKHIEAIVAYRKGTHASLKDAKAAVARFET